jgi:hypothetical protein
LGDLTPSKRAAFLLWRAFLAALAAFTLNRTFQCADQLVNNEAQTNMLRRAVTKILDTIESIIHFLDYFSDISSPYNKFNEGPLKFEKAKSR